MGTEDRFQLHELEWTSAKIARFWDFESQNGANAGNYFTNQVGDALIRVARAHGALTPPVLDYGAGVGYLTERLVRLGVRCAACDFSPSSVAALNQRLHGHPAFMGCELLKDLPSALPDQAYGAVFLAETLEHLIPEWRRRTLEEVRRVLKPGGHLVVTVPFAERMEAASVLCADCGAVFHRVQHVASFDEKSLSAAMAPFGFAEVCCRPLDLRNWTDEMQRPGLRLRRCLRRILTRLRMVAPRLEATPNLVYVGIRAG